MMRSSGVELDAVALFDLLASAEYTPVVSRDGAENVRVPLPISHQMIRKSSPSSAGSHRVPEEIDEDTQTHS
jgi:hypothetical protein